MKSIIQQQYFENFVHRKLEGPKLRKNAAAFSSFWESSLLFPKFTGCISCIRPSIVTFLPVKSYPNAKKCLLFPCKGKLLGETSQKFNIGVIGFDLQSRFPSKRVSNFFPSKSQSAIVFLLKMVQFSFLFSSALEKFNNPEWPKLMYMYDASLY